MTIEQWVGIGVGISTLVGAFAISVRHLVKYYLAELRPNGGSSIKDKIKDIDEKVNKLEARIDEIYRLLLDRA
jgi:hypothetical protein